MFEFREDSDKNAIHAGNVGIAAAIVLVVIMLLRSLVGVVHDALRIGSRKQSENFLRYRVESADHVARDGIADQNGGLSCRGIIGIDRAGVEALAFRVEQLTAVVIPAGWGPPDRWQRKGWPWIRSGRN